MNKNRTCGDCIVCCSYLRIESDELNKLGLKHCPFAKLEEPEKEGMLQYSGSTDGKNCSAFGTDKRPGCCGNYNCLWRLGYGSEDDRPDKIWMLFDVGLNKIDNALEAKPLRPGAEDTPEGIAATERMSLETGLPALVLEFPEQILKRVVGKGL